MPDSSRNSPAPGRPTRPFDERWRVDNIGRLLSNALRQFEGRVIQLMSDAGYPQITASHIQATRHLDVAGTRLTDMARRAAMTKQSMSELVRQLEDVGLVTRRLDPDDGRARLVFFTDAGLSWLAAFGRAVRQAEQEMADAVGGSALQRIKAALAAFGSIET